MLFLVFFVGDPHLLGAVMQADDDEEVRKLARLTADDFTVQPLIEQPDKKGILAGIVKA